MALCVGFYPGHRSGLGARFAPYGYREPGNASMMTVGPGRGFYTVARLPVQVPECALLLENALAGRAGRLPQVDVVRLLENIDKSMREGNVVPIPRAVMYFRVAYATEIQATSSSVTCAGGSLYAGGRRLRLKRATKAAPEWVVYGAAPMGTGRTPIIPVVVPPRLYGLLAPWWERGMPFIPQIEAPGGIASFDYPGQTIQGLNLDGGILNGCAMHKCLGGYGSSAPGSDALVGSRASPWTSLVQAIETVATTEVRGMALSFASLVGMEPFYQRVETVLKKLEPLVMGWHASGVSSGAGEGDMDLPVQAAAEMGIWDMESSICREVTFDAGTGFAIKHDHGTDALPVLEDDEVLAVFGATKGED